MFVIYSLARFSSKHVFLTFSIDPASLLILAASVGTKRFDTICPKSSDPFYIVTYYIKWVTTSWTHSMYRFSSSIVLYAGIYILQNTMVLWMADRKNMKKEDGGKKEKNGKIRKLHHKTHISGLKTFLVLMYDLRNAQFTSLLIC